LTVLWPDAANRPEEGTTRAASWIGLAVGLGALLLQFYVTLTLRAANGHDFPGTLVYFFTFYTILTIFNHLLLADLQDLSGLSAFCDLLLHYVTPAYFVLWWIVLQPKGTLRIADIPIMLLPTLIWLVWAMVRGAIVGEYPYPILDAQKLGYAAVGINCVYVFVGLLVLYIIVIGLDRALAGKLPRG
jgi:hypothetical protein